ncbi:MAG: ketoacyl-ACP synthase III, partial [Pseudomonadota bacterium]
MPRMMFAGIGTYLPERVVTNFDLEKIMETSDEWIQQRTGIVERHWVADGEQSSDMARVASEKALAEAGVKAEDLDLIIYATLASELYFPGNAVFLQQKLGIKDVPCLDIRNQCSGSLYGLAIANGMIVSGMYQRILLVGSEVHSRGLDKTTKGRDVAVIFGDGAGAAVLTATDQDKGLIDVYLGADGKYAESLAVRSMGSRWERFVTDE